MHTIFVFPFSIIPLSTLYVLYIFSKIALSKTYLLRSELTERMLDSTLFSFMVYGNVVCGLMFIFCVIRGRCSWAGKSVCWLCGM